MTNKYCDICKNKVKELNEVRDEFKVYDIVEICDQCMNDINKAIRQAENAWFNKRRGMIRRLIDNMKSLVKIK